MNTYVLDLLCWTSVQLCIKDQYFFQILVSFVLIWSVQLRFSSSIIPRNLIHDSFTLVFRSGNHSDISSFRGFVFSRFNGSLLVLLGKFLKFVAHGSEELLNVAIGMKKIYVVHKHNRTYESWSLCKVINVYWKQN